MGLAFLHNSGGSGGNGALLIVTVRAGATVTVSKDNKTKTKISGESGVVRFKGLETGEWTVSATDGVQTVTGQVTITSDYVTSLAFFAATISISYPEGSTCTVSDGVTTITAPDTTGVWECIVPNEGTWTVTATDGENVKSEDVVVETDGQTESITLMYWNGELYMDGTWYTGNTGDWVSLGKKIGSSSYKESAPLIENGENSFRLYFTGGYSQSGMYYLEQKMDLTNYTALRFEGELNYYENKKGARVQIWSDVGTYTTTNVVAYLEKSGLSNGVGTIDVSALNGEYHIGFNLYHGKSQIICRKLYLT